MAASETWSDPEQCPFCGESLPSPGKGFMIHLNENPECDGDFETWRSRVTEDIGGGWAG